MLFPRTTATFMRLLCSTRSTSYLSPTVVSKLESFVDQNLTKTDDIILNAGGVSTTSHNLFIERDIYIDIKQLLVRFRQYQRNIIELRQLIEEVKGTKDAELTDEANHDLQGCQKKMVDLEIGIVDKVCQRDPVDRKDVILEIHSGAGGQEAMLFATNLFNMYAGFSLFMGWNFRVTEKDLDELGGLRRALAEISGADVFGNLKFEGGVHRVQRIPSTESGGRMHTSTVAVAVLPVASEIDVVLNQKDIKLDTFRAQGKGGQHVNKTDSAVRLTHLPTGIVVESQESRDQHGNRKTALDKLRNILYAKAYGKAVSAEQQQRKLQIGTRERSERIRTYNFQQDRITDHRIKLSMSNVNAVLSGKNELKLIVDALKRYHKTELFEEFLIKNKIV